MVEPSGNSTVIVVSGSACPVIGSLPLFGFTSGTAGGVASTTISFGSLALPAGSVAITLMVSPSSRPGFSTSNWPSLSATVVIVLPSGNSTVTVVSGSTLPVIGSLPLFGLTSGTVGGIASTTISLGSLVLPAGSVAVTLTLSPSSNPGFFTVKLPFLSATVVSVLPSGYFTVTVESGSARPVIGSLPLTGSTSGKSGAFASTVTIVFSLSASPLTTTTESLSPSLRPGFFTSNVPFSPTFADAVEPSGKVTTTVEPGSALPVIGFLSLTGLTFAGAGRSPRPLPEVASSARRTARPPAHSPTIGSAASLDSAINSGSME